MFGGAMPDVVMGALGQSRLHRQRTRQGFFSDVLIDDRARTDRAGRPTQPDAGAVIGAVGGMPAV
jgi:hypothetical protein